jgi:hypothetical protein
MKGGNAMNELFDNVISVYTADDAVADGMLMEVPENLAKEAGFNWTVRVTTAVVDLLTPPEGSAEDFTGRLWDVLVLARWAIKASDDDHFTTFVVKIGGKNHTLWICLDTTSGPALHIITPEDY